MATTRKPKPAPQRAANIAPMPKAAARKRPTAQNGTQGRYTALGYRVDQVLIREGRIVPIGRSNHTSEMYQRTRILAQSRDFLRNNEIYKGIIERMVTYIIGGGFTLQAQTRKPKLNQRLEVLLKQWGRDCEVGGLITWRQAQRLICREFLTAGDAAAIKTTSGQIQLIESEQITTANDPTGITVSPNGRPLAYHIAPYINGYLQSGQAKPYEPKDILFIADPERPSDLRGFPLLQSAFPMLHRITDTCDGEALAMQMQSRLALSVTRQEAEAKGYTDSIEDTDTNAGAITDRVTELDYALIFNGEPGEEIKGIDRTAPGPHFPETLRMFLRLLGLPAGLPLEHILLDWTGGNYSQSRAVLEQAYTTFRCIQDLIETAFCSPVYKWKVQEWQAKGLLDKDGGKGMPLDELLNHTWVRPTFPWIDQLKETEAYGAKVDRGFATHADVLKSLGHDRDDIMAQREKEIRDAIERAKRIKADTDVDVPWEMFAGNTRGKTEAAFRANQQESPANA